MGNVHSVTQVYPKFHKPGAAIKVVNDAALMERDFAAWKAKDHFSLQRLQAFVQCANINEDASRFEPDQTDLYLVLASGSKYGYGSELNHLLHRFSHHLEDAIFFLEDEYSDFFSKHAIAGGNYSVESFPVMEDGLAQYFRDISPNRDMEIKLETFNALAWEQLVDEQVAPYALEDARRALKLNPDFWRLHYLEGTIYLKQNLPAQALVSFQNAMRLKQSPGSKDDFGSRRIFHAMSLAHSHMKEFELAIAAADKALNICPNFGDYTPLESKGYALMEMGKHHEAIECFNTILKESGRRTDIAYAFYNKACALASLGKWTQAIQSLAAALAMDNHTLRLQEHAKSDPALASLLTKPGVKALMKSVTNG
jgi:tetratricopeptide (TPR) repeat protein